MDILIYIDDTFLRAPTPELLSQNLLLTQSVFASAGLTVNTRKSCLNPCQKMEFLGFVFDSVEFTIAVTDHKF